jgi:polysaccharide export outer membrane protein
MQPLATFGLLALVTLGCPGRGLAQLPVIEETEPIPSNSPFTRQEEAYTLGAGDRIRVEVFQVPQLSGEHEVLVNGTLNLPQVGRVLVEGLTLEEAERAISQQYARILRRPIVTVNLLSRRPVRIGIAGEVRHPGSYEMSIQGSQFPTVTQAIEQAGGITQAADLRNVRVRRRQGASEEVVQLNLWELLQTGNIQDDLTLRDGDTLFIPTATTVNLEEVSQLADASFSSDEVKPLNVVVVGEVYRPGPYTVTGTARTGAAGVPGGASGGDVLPTVTRAIQVAGGIKPQANVRQIQVYRTTRTGSKQTIEVNLWQLLQTGDSSQDVILQEGDSIFVPTAPETEVADASEIAAASFSPDTIRVNVVGEAEQPKVVQVPPNTPLNQALLAAGGFNNRARKSSVELIRLNPNGTVTQRTIPVDFAQGVNEETNPPLRNDDIIVVDRSGLAKLSDTLDTAIGPLGRILTILNFPFRLFGIF